MSTTNNAVFGAPQTSPGPRVRVQKAYKGSQMRGIKFVKHIILKFIRYNSAALPQRAAKSNLGEGQQSH